VLHFIYYYAECHYAECRYAECRSAECLHSECRYAECRHAECRYVVMLSVIAPRRTISPTNIRIGYLPGTKHSSLLCRSFREDRKKSF
jgi:hypothetical protein